MEIWKGNFLGCTVSLKFVPGNCVVSFFFFFLFFLVQLKGRQLFPWLWCCLTIGHQKSTFLTNCNLFKFYPQQRNHMILSTKRPSFKSFSVWIYCYTILIDILINSFHNNLDHLKCHQRNKRFLSKRCWVMSARCHIKKISNLHLFLLCHLDWMEWM